MRTHGSLEHKHTTVPAGSAALAPKAYEGEGGERDSIQRPFGEATLSLCRSSGGAVDVHGKDRGSRPNPPFELILAMAAAQMDCGSSRLTMRRGDMVLIDVAASTRLSSDGPLRWLSFSIPRRLIEDHMAGAKDVAPIFISREGVVASLFRSTLLILWRTTADADLGQYVELVESHVDMLMRTVLEAVQDATTFEAVRIRALVAISTFVYRHLGDPEFGLSALLAAFGLARGELNKVLGLTSAADLIRKCRLSAARRILRSGAGSHLSVGEVGRRVGFSSLSRFSTAYTESYGVSPTTEKQHQAAASAELAIAAETPHTRQAA